MTSYSHAPNNHLSRRASITATSPYTIPTKSHNNSNTNSSSTPFSPPPSNVHIPQHQMSSSVPLLSREFVVRRISEGESGRLKEELKCEACGKGYKHISSLAKHLWEHTPEWNVTKKLLISKHQQVQLLEAASILISMNEVSPKKGIETIDEEENGNSAVKFNDKYREQNSMSNTTDADNSFVEDGTTTKPRTHSISQYPPSQLNNITSPSIKLNNGGFLDIPGRATSEEVIIDESGDENEAEDSKEDEDEGVFGKMD